MKGERGKGGSTQEKEERWVRGHRKKDASKILPKIKERKEKGRDEERRGK